MSLVAQNITGVFDTDTSTLSAISTKDGRGLTPIALASMSAAVSSILLCGDSFSRIGDVTEAPAGFTPTGLITGLGVEGVEIANCLRPNATVVPLLWNASAQTLKFGSGDPVKITRSGVMIIPDVVPQQGVMVTLRIPELPTTDASLTIATSTARPDVGRRMLSLSNWFSIFDGQRHAVINISGGGQTLAACVTNLQYAKTQYKYAAVVLALGINDIGQALVFANPLAEMQRRFMAAYVEAVSCGVPCVGVFVPSNNRTETTAYSELVSKFNTWLSTIGRTLRGLEVVNLWDSMTNSDPSAITGRANYVDPADDLHPLSPAVQVAGYRLWQATQRLGLRGVDPFDSYPRGGASANNPGGNLITNPWQFGTAGTVSGANASGVASDSFGLANGSTALSALVGSKVSRSDTDYVDAPWQRMTVTSVTDSAFCTLTSTLLSGGPPPVAGDLVQILAEIQVDGDILCCDVRTQMVGAFGGLNPYLRSMFPDVGAIAIPMPIAKYRGVIATKPFVWPSGAAPTAPFFNVYTRNGTTGAKVDIGRVVFRRLLDVTQ